ncbi:hypothetical protein RC62_1058 [Flavobacterium aquidurense]|uniref:PH domain-containing protein n=2 Tax=Flavobacterium aquidurense TaxID=362413 RepID=A0A0Q0XT74_9FLAO|nr:hypothetical protein RC62_1058 [Flavobacterium aquidurense]
MSLVYFFTIFLFFNSVEEQLKIYLFIPYFLLLFFPVIILHVNYLKENRGVVVEITENILLLKKGNFIKEYHVNQINEIVVYTGGTRNTVSPGLAHSNYYYVKIKLQDGLFFIITSLYSCKIDKILQVNFKNVKITTEKVFYPIIKK